MNRNRTSPNWNKVAIVPIDATSNSSGVLLNVTHSMEMTSCRLIKEPLTVSVIYSKFE